MGSGSFLAVRYFLLAHREDYAAAVAKFRWPTLDRFNWALDYFDPMAAGNAGIALWIVDATRRETKISFRGAAGAEQSAGEFLRNHEWPATGVAGGPP